MALNSCKMIMDRFVCSEMAAVKNSVNKSERMQRREHASTSFCVTMLTVSKPWGNQETKRWSRGHGVVSRFFSLWWRPNKNVSIPRQPNSMTPIGGDSCQDSSSDSLGNTSDFVISIEGKILGGENILLGFIWILHGILFFFWEPQTFLGDSFGIPYEIIHGIYETRNASQMQYKNHKTLFEDYPRILMEIFLKISYENLLKRSNSSGNYPRNIQEEHVLDGFEILRLFRDMFKICFGAKCFI